MTRKRIEITLLQLLRGKNPFPASLPGPGIWLASALFIGISLFFEWKSGGWPVMPDNFSGAVAGVAKEFLFSSLYDAIKPMLAATAFRGCTVAAKAWSGRLPKALAIDEKS